MSRASFPTPALDSWRDELRRGLRTVHDRDGLWRAAGADLRALEAHVDDLPGIARAFSEDARRALAAAAKAAA